MNIAETVELDAISARQQVRRIVREAIEGHMEPAQLRLPRNVVLAARYDATDMLTIDQRDFRDVELPGGRYFRILPYHLGPSDTGQSSGRDDRLRAPVRMAP